MQPPLIQIVDSADVPLRGGTMDEAQLQGLWHRVAGVMIQDEASREFLVQKIAPNPYYNGGKWNLTSTGHVDAGEKYNETIRRELLEEMGIDDASLKLTDFSYYQSERQDFRANKQRLYRRHNKVYLVMTDKTHILPRPNMTEVEDWRWVSLAELASDDFPKSNMLQQFVDDYQDRFDVVK